VRGVGESLADIGFFAVANHDLGEDLTRAAYDAARAFFALPPAAKARYTVPGTMGQRGYTKVTTNLMGF